MGLIEQRFEENCEIARENLRVLSIPSPKSRYVHVRGLDEDGAMVELNEAQMQARREQARQNIRDYCG